MSIVTVEATHLSRAYGQRFVVREVDFSLKKGEVLGFLGPNGAGKSTTMRMVTGNLAPTVGQVKICGIDIVEKPKDAKALIGYLPETPPLYRDMTVDEFLVFSARMHRVARSHVKKAVESVKERCGLTQMGGRLIENLSKGYQQRVGIAQAIIHQPMVVILDEPTVGLDPIQIRDIRTLIKELGGQHSVILSTHILPEVEIVCDQVQIIHEGRLVFNGAIDLLRTHRHGNQLMVGFRHPPAMDDLLQIAGVMQAERLDNGLFQITCADNQDPTDLLVEQAYQHRWQLYEIHPYQRTLEEVFVKLTFQDEVSPAGSDV